MDPKIGILVPKTYIHGKLGLKTSVVNKTTVHKTKAKTKAAHSKTKTKTAHTKTKTKMCQDQDKLCKTKTKSIKTLKLTAGVSKPICTNFASSIDNPINMYLCNLIDGLVQLAKIKSSVNHFLPDP